MHKISLALSVFVFCTTYGCGASEPASPDGTGPKDAVALDAGREVEETALDVLDQDGEPEVIGADGALPDTAPADSAVLDVVAVDAAAPADVEADIPEPVAPCPSLEVLNGLEVSPPVLLSLSGGGTTGDVARWQWTVVSKPSHSFTGLNGAHSREATFEAAVAGVYTFRLEAWDEKDRTACDAAEVTVNAVPTSPIHIELWWNDNNADPTAELGADLDLHVMHPNAVGIDVGGSSAPDGWFDPLYDVAWHNPQADWPGPVGDEANGPRVKLLRRDHR